MTENLDVFFIDFGVDVVVGGVSKAPPIQGIYSAPGEIIADGMVISDNHSVLMKASDTIGLKADMPIRVDGVDYYVRTPIQVGDGKLVQVTMSKA